MMSHSPYPTKSAARACRLPGVILALWIGTLPAIAQTYTLTISSAPNLGNVVSSGTGNTVFTVDPQTGVTTRTSGTGVRLATGDARALISVTCGNTGPCNTKTPGISIASAGSPTKRAGPLNNFTVSLKSGAFDHNPTGTNPLTFGLQPIPKNTTQQFYVGYDYTIAGDNSGLATGVAGSAFLIKAGPAVFGNITGAFTSLTGNAAATVFRPISMTSSQGLAFGRIVRPRAGSGSVTIDPASGVRTATGATFLSAPAATVAIYSVTGEGGQTFSIAVPSSFVLNSGSSNVTVTLANTASGSASLSSALGAGGSYSFKVGGTVPLTSTTKDGAYTGTFSVTAQYN